MNLKDKVAVVTGSSRGLGRTMAIKLAEYGAHIVVNYRNNRDAAEETGQAVRELGRQAHLVQADVTQAEQVSHLIETAVNHYGHIDITVNNVGDFFLKPLGQMETQEWHYVIDSNLSSVFYLCQSALPYMRKQASGRIINIGLSPNYTVRGAPNIAAYSIAKTGVLIFTRSLATEEAAHGITVNCVSPGLIDNGHLPEEQKEWMEKRVPMGRLGDAKEVAEAVSFLASDKASYISGANLTVSGGWDWGDRQTGHDSGVWSLFVDKS